MVASRSACVLRPDTKPNSGKRSQIGRAAQVEAAAARPPPPQLAHQGGIAADQVEDETLEVRGLGDVHRRAGGVLAFPPCRAADRRRCGRTRRARRSRWWPGPAGAIGRPIMRAMWPAQMLPKLPDGTRTTTCSSLLLGRREVALEVVDDLRRHARPVDGIDRADAVAVALNARSLDDRLDDVLAVVEHAAHGDVEDVGDPAASTSARAGRRLILPCGESMKTRMPCLPRMAYSAAEPVSPEVAPRMLSVLAGPLQHVFEQVAQQLHGHVLEGQRRAVGQFEQMQARLQGAQRRDLGGGVARANVAKRLRRVGLVDDGLQVGRRNVGRRSARAGQTPGSRYPWPRHCASSAADNLRIALGQGRAAVAAPGRPAGFLRRSWAACRRGCLCNAWRLP